MKSLNKRQAKAIADALAALNSVGGSLDEVLLPERTSFVVYPRDTGCGVNKNGRTVEAYDTIRDFLVAYGVTAPCTPTNTDSRQQTRRLTGRLVA